MKTILVVDDESCIAETVAEVLREEGYQCLTAANGQEALDVLQATRPDLVLCDVMMPVLDGRDVLRRIRSTPELASIPVVMTSAAWAVLDEDAGHTAFLRKPFKLDELLRIVTCLIGAP